MSMNRSSLITMIVLCMIFLGAFSGLAFAIDTTPQFVRGFGNILTGVFQLPAQVLYQSFTKPPIVGTVYGVFTGTYLTLTQVVGGVFDMAMATAPYAKYALVAI